MRYLHRTHRISVTWLHECFQRTDFDLVYEETSKMCADIYTKGFTDSLKWEQACWLINVVEPKRLKELLRGREPAQRGGVCSPISHDAQNVGGRNPSDVSLCQHAGGRKSSVACSNRRSSAQTEVMSDPIHNAGFDANST